MTMATGTKGNWAVKKCEPLSGGSPESASEAITSRRYRRFQPCCQMRWEMPRVP